MLKMIKLAATVATLLLLPAISFAQPSYDVNFTSNAPTIDGVVSPGEWADAAAAEGGWRILRDPAGRADAHNNRFQLMWDNTNLYLLTESDFGGWTTNQRDQFRSGANNLNIYFDPDLDGEGNQGDILLGPFSNPDGYQIAVNQYFGSYQCTACSTEMDFNLTNPITFGETGSDFSTFAEAHIDELFGNDGMWLGMRGTVMASVNGSTGGVVEMAIPWTDFDAPGLDESGVDPGLNINGASPTSGDEWLFNIAQITTDDSNPLPVWSWHDNPDGQEFFAAQPHGVLTFVEAQALKGDVNLDGEVTFFDIAPFIAALTDASTQPEADVDCSGEVNFFDIQPFIDILAGNP